MKLTCGSLFSGIGGFDLGFERAGFKSCWFVEQDKFCQSVLQTHWPSVIGFNDIRNVGRQKLERVSVITGGFPCQDLSVAGQRKGLTGERSALFFEYARVAGELRPKWFVCENVPGLLSSAEGKDFDLVVETLSELGYGLAWRTLDSQYFGVPQRRRRVFVVGCLGDWRSAAAVLFERHSLQGDHPPRREKGQGSAASTLRSTDGGLDIDHATAGHIVSGAVSSKWAKGTGGPAGDECYNLVTHSLRADGFDASEDGTGRGTPIIPILEAGVRTGKSTDDPRAGMGVGEDGDPMFTLQSGKQHAIGFYANDSGHDSQDECAPTLRAMPGGGGNHPAVAIRTAQTSANGHGIAEDVAHKPDGAQGQAVAFTTEQTPKFSPDSALTLTKQSPTGGGQPQAVMHGMAVRRLTPRECERLQGFPDDFTLVAHRGKSAADGPRYKALGNAVTVNVAEWIARRIVQVEKGEL